MKKKLTSPPILALPKFTGQFTVELDASDGQLGCFLLQEQDDKQQRPIGYWSNSLRSAERMYDTTHMECLAVVWCVQVLRPYLEGPHFVVRSDHPALRWMLDLKESIRRLARWRLRLCKFDFEVVQRPGVYHQAQVATSRLLTRTVEKELDVIDEDRPSLDLQHTEKNHAALVIPLSQDFAPMRTPAEIAEAQI